MFRGGKYSSASEYYARLTVNLTTGDTTKSTRGYSGLVSGGVDFQLIGPSGYLASRYVGDEVSLTCQSKPEPLAILHR